MVSFATAPSAPLGAEATEEEIQRLLRQAGIESAPIDPSSMDALRDLVQQRHLNPRQGGQKEAVEDVTTKVAPTLAKLPPPSSSPSDPSTVAAASASGAAATAASPSPHYAAYAPSSVASRLSALKKDHRDGEYHEEHHVSFSDLGEVGDDLHALDQKLPATSPSKMVAKKFEDKAPSIIDRSIMDQLEFQTSLLVDMQRRLEDLNTKVERLENRQDGGASIATNTRSYTYGYNNTDNASTANQTNQQTPVAVTAAPVETPRGGQQRQPRQGEPVVGEQPQEPQPPQEFFLLSLLLNPFRSVWAIISNSKVFEILKLYWKLSDEYGVRPLDGGILFKLLFVMLVFSARLSRVKDRYHNQNKYNSNGNNKSDGSGWNANDVRFYVSILVMTLGFLYHTKYLQYTIQFVYTDNIPWRVLNGEHVEHLGPPQPPTEQPPDINHNERHAQQNNNEGGNEAAGRRGIGGIAAPGNNNNNQNGAVENNNNGWRDTFIGGGIQPAQEEQNPIVAGIQDAMYLFGSFFFSIFPMWHPEQPAQPGVDGGDGDNSGGNGNGGDENDNNDNGLPQVQPPRDAMEPADDED